MLYSENKEISVTDKLTIENALRIVAKSLIALPGELFEVFSSNDQSRELIMDGLFHKELRVRKAFENELTALAEKMPTV